MKEGSDEGGGESVGVVSGLQREAVGRNSFLQSLLNQKKTSGRKEQGSIPLAMVSYTGQRTKLKKSKELQDSKGDISCSSLTVLE